MGVVLMQLDFENLNLDEISLGLSAYGLNCVTDEDGDLIVSNDEMPISQVVRLSSERKEITIFSYYPFKTDVSVLDGVNFLNRANSGAYITKFFLIGESPECVVYGSRVNFCPAVVDLNQLAVDIQRSSFDMRDLIQADSEDLFFD